MYYMKNESRKNKVQPVYWCWSKLWNIYSCPLTNMKRASGGVQKSIVLWVLFLSRVADIHDESFGFFWLLGNVRFFPFRLRFSTHKVPSPYNSTERDGAVPQALSLPHKQTLQDILCQHHNGGYGTATWLLVTILLSALWTDLASGKEATKVGWGESGQLKMATCRGAASSLCSQSPHSLPDTAQQLIL